MNKKVKHGGHKHELQLEFTKDLEASTVKQGFYDYCMRMAAEKYRKISGQDQDYHTTADDRAMAKTIDDTGVWKTNDQFVLGSMKSRVVEKVPMTIEEMKTNALPGMDNAQLDDLIKMAEELKAAKELAEEHSDEDTAIAAG